MKTTLASTHTPAALSAAVEAAVRFLGEGLPVALPTETVYGLAADATRPEAVLKIFEAKERPFFDPLIVHIPDREWLARLTEVPEGDAALVQRLIAHFWPGPLTLVLPRSSLVPDLVASGLPTVAIRQSAHPVFQAIVSALGKPLAAPSANRFGRISPTAAGHVMSELEGRIPLVVDGGETSHGVESTIIAVARGEIEILRSGPITREELEPFASLVAAGGLVKPVAPGQLKSHYAPSTPMHLLASGETAESWLAAHAVTGAAGAGEPTGSLGLLAWQNPSGNLASRFSHIEVLNPKGDGDPREAATRLFAAMRRLDAAALTTILAEPVPEMGLGVAIMDRLRKASYGSHHPA